jgi:hypothetical protein
LQKCLVTSGGIVGTYDHHKPSQKRTAFEALAREVRKRIVEGNRANVPLSKREGVNWQPSEEPYWVHEQSASGNPGGS